MTIHEERQLREACYSQSQRLLFDNALIRSDRLVILMLISGLLGYLVKRFLG